MSAKKKVVMFQLPYQEIRSIPLWSNSPWGAAMLKATAFQNGLADSFEIIIVPTALVNHAGDVMLLDYLEAEQPDIICATLYLWNASRSLYLAEQLKKRLPNLLFIVGGPEVHACCSYIVDNPVVDYGCIGEGEVLFVAMLRAFASGVEPPPLPGLFFRRDGELQVVPGRGSVADLAQLPSPLQMGILNLVNEPIVTYETMRGCPCTCSYCVTGAQTWRAFPADRVVADLEMLHNQRVKKVRLSCSNFLLHPEFFDICSSLALINADKSMELICFSYAEHVTLEKAEALKSCNFVLLEIGLQTVSAKTLKLIRRPPFDESRFLEGLAYLRNMGISFSIDLIAGLPDESPEDIDNTLAFVKRNRFQLYSVFPLQLLPGSPLRNEAEAYGIDARTEPPYTVIRTRSLSPSQIQAYANKTEIGRDEIRFDLAREFCLPGFAAFNLTASDAAATAPLLAPIAKILISSTVDPGRFMAAEGNGIASSVIMIFSNLEQSLASCTAIIGAVLQRNPFTLIMPVFEVSTAAEMEEVLSVCRSIAGPQLVKKTVVKDAALMLSQDDCADFTLFEAFQIDSVADAGTVAACSSDNILIDLSPLLDAADLVAIMVRLVDCGKNIKYRNLALYYLDHLIRQHQQGGAVSIHAPVDIGRIVAIDAKGETVTHLFMNNRLTLAITHMQLLFMRFIQSSLKAGNMH